MLRFRNWHLSSLEIVAATVCGLAVLAVALGRLVLAPRLAGWKARRRVRRREAHLEVLRTSLLSQVGDSPLTSRGAGP